MAWEADLRAKEDRRRRGESVDFPFLFLTLLLLTVGLVMLWSASYAQSEYDTGYAISTRYLQKQAVCAAIGLVAMYGFSRIPAKLWYRLAWPLYGLGIVLLLSVLAVGQERLVLLVTHDEALLAQCDARLISVENLVQPH